MNAPALEGGHALVTGASGFVGANLVRGLLERGCEVTALVRPSSDLWRLAGVLHRITVRHAELEDAASLASLDDGEVGGLVFHAAAAGVRPGDAAGAVLAANLRGTLNLLERLARRGSGGRLVFCSSCSVYGDAAGAAEDAPLRGRGAYAQSKIAGEAMVQAYAASGRIPAVTLRLYTPYGPYEAPYRFVAGSLLKALAGQDLTLTPGEQTRDLIHIGDVVRALVAAATVPGIEGETVNVCTGAATAIRDAAALIAEVAGTGSRPVPGALPYRADEVWSMSGNPARMRELLGIRSTTSLADGLRASCGWFIENAGLYDSAAPGAMQGR